jgi:hypothetical protein
VRNNCILHFYADLHIIRPYVGWLELHFALPLRFCVPAYRPAGLRETIFCIFFACRPIGLTTGRWLGASASLRETIFCISLRFCALREPKSDKYLCPDFKLQLSESFKQEISPFHQFQPEKLLYEYRILS